MDLHLSLNKLFLNNLYNLKFLKILILINTFFIIFKLIIINLKINKNINIKSKILLLKIIINTFFIILKLIIIYLKYLKINKNININSKILLKYYY